MISRPAVGYKSKFPSIAFPQPPFTRSILTACKASSFRKGSADNAPHTLILDEIKIADAGAADSTSSQTLLPSLPRVPHPSLLRVGSSFAIVRPERATSPGPQNLNAKAYDRHVDLIWDPVPPDQVERYVIYRSDDGKNFQPIGIQVRGITRYTDYLGKPPRTAQYKVAASDATYRQSNVSGAVDRDNARA